MPNPTDFGIDASTLNGIINPSKNPHAFCIGPAYTATATASSVGTVGTFHDPTANFRQDQYNDYWLVFPSDNTRRLITSTIGGTIETEATANLSTYSGEAYTLESNTAIATTDAMGIVRRVVGEVKSQLPEKYRRMLYEVRGEYLVERARYHQATAHTTFKVADHRKLWLWHNPTRPQSELTVHQTLISPSDVTDGRGQTSDYTVGTATTTVITFQFGGSTGDNGKLSHGAVVVADYTHDLPTVPKVLQKVALDRAAYEILWQQGVGASALSEDITKFKEQSDATLAALQEGKIGIDEFDTIRLYTETRGEKSQSGYGFVGVDRG